jgi:uncharacterized protein YwqG
MAGNGMTGINPGQVKASIESLHDTFSTGLSHLFEDTDKLFRELQTYWCSPNAVEFSNKYGPYFIDVLNESIKEIKKMCGQAAQAANVVATVHGLGTISVDIAEHVFYSLTALHDHSNSGDIGINKYYVERALSEFYISKASDVSIIDSAMSDIALFDPAEEQRRAYQITFVTVRSKIVLALDEIIDEIKAAIEYEKNKALRAKDVAANILAG